jgi:hypothetical protein
MTDKHVSRLIVGLWVLTVGVAMAGCWLDQVGSPFGWSSVSRPSHASSRRGAEFQAIGLSLALI